MTGMARHVSLRDVARIHIQLQRDRVCMCCDTTEMKCAILMELASSGPVRLADLAHRLGVDKGWTSRAVDTMVQEGLLLKVPGESDRRTITISMTEAGLKRHLQLDKSLDALTERVMMRIPVHERASVYKALEWLEGALRAELENGAFDPCSVGGGCVTTDKK